MATPRPCRKIAGRVSASGGAVAACPVMASDRPTPVNAMIARARAYHALRRATSASSIASRATSRAGPALVATATFQGAAVARAGSGRPRRSRPNAPRHAAALGKPRASARRGTAIPVIDPAIQRAKNTPPTPTNSPTYRPTRVSQINAFSPPSTFVGAFVAVGMPIEKITDPVTGWPSCEITR